MLWLVWAPASEARAMTEAGRAAVPDVADFLYEGGTSTTRPVPHNGATVEAWRLEELRTYPNQPSSADMHAELDRIRRGAKVKWGLRVLGRVALPVAGAATAGWGIGTVIRRQLFEDELPARTTLTGWDPGYQEMVAVQRGDCIQYWAYPWEVTKEDATDAQASSNCTGGGPVSGSLEDPATLRAPADGWVLVFREPGGFRNFYTVQVGPGPEGPLHDRLHPDYASNFIEGCRQIKYPLSSVSEGPQGFRSIGASDANGNPVYRVEAGPDGPNYYNCHSAAVEPQIITDRAYVWFKPSLGIARPLRAEDQPSQGTKDVEVPDPGREVVQSTVEENLCAEGYVNLARFVAEQVAAAVCEGQEVVEVPSCEGLGYDECVARLNTAGFSRTERAVLSFDDADLGRPADALVRIAPEAGRQAPPGTKVTLWVNPPEPDMPVLVPAPGAHEQAGEYLARLQALQLEGFEDEQHDWVDGHASGEVIGVSPTGRQPKGTRVRVDVQNRKPCDRTPQTEDPYAGGYPGQWHEFPGFTELGSKFPVSAPIPRTTLLLWGVREDPDFPGTGFGYAKIAAKHGWGPQDETSTRTVLATDLDPVPRPELEAGWAYAGDDFRGLDGRRCERLVVVDFGTRPGNPSPEHIITSFGQDFGRGPGG